MNRKTPFLPDPFLREDGTRVSKPEEWPEQVAYIRRLAQIHMYGTWPGQSCQPYRQDYKD